MFGRHFAPGGLPLWGKTPLPSGRGPSVLPLAGFPFSVSDYMSHQGVVTLQPSRLDVAISKRCARAATPARERSLRIMTWLADEKILLGAVGLFWLNARLRSHDEEFRREADRMLLGIAIAGVVPHVFKHLINRKRPDRTLVHGPRHGIPRSGDAWDSFPSGHALHLGALAGPLVRLAPRSAKPLVWISLLGLAPTRIMLLAHYVSDVAAGLIIGAGLGKAVRKLTEQSPAGTSASALDKGEREVE
jgi:membrane-associated phospholipid phosphatase